MPVTKTSGQGRPKGAPNKVTTSIKEMVLAALNDVGGREYLAERAKDQPVAFMGLLGRVLPLQLTGENGGALVIDFRWADAPEPEPPTIDADEPVSLTFVVNEC
jgi:hypothetical protein